MQPNKPWLFFLCQPPHPTPPHPTPCCNVSFLQYPFHVCNGKIDSTYCSKAFFVVTVVISHQCALGFATKFVSKTQKQSNYKIKAIVCRGFGTAFYRYPFFSQSPSPLSLTFFWQYYTNEMKNKCKDMKES